MATLILPFSDEVHVVDRDMLVDVVDGRKAPSKTSSESMKKTSL